MNNGTNHLLAALPRTHHPLLWADLHPVSLLRGEVLFEPGVRPSALVFPTTAVLSLAMPMRDGACTEFAVVGREGVAGIALFLGGGTLPYRATVQSAGLAWRMPSRSVGTAVAEGSQALAVLLRYIEARMTQTLRLAACQRHHSVVQRLSLRLMMGLDRASTDELEMTHEEAAGLLGVRREGVSVAASRLQACGAIRYHRGHIRVLDRGLLERHACECHRPVRQDFRRTEPQPLVA